MASSTHPERCGPWRELTAGAGFTEGPVASGDTVVFVSVNRGTLYRAPLDGGAHAPVAEVGGGPNGLAVDGDGRLWVAQNGGRVLASRSWPVAPSVQVVARDGAVTTVADARLNAPNDCAFGPDGRLWFTDPRRRQPGEEPAAPAGRVWAYDPLAGTFAAMAERLTHPNGLCFAADGTLLVSDTAERAILRFAPSEAGWQGPELHARVPHGAPDGMALDEDGRLWVAATSAEGLAVLDPSGGWGFVDLGPSFPTNVCFAGERRTTLVVTAARGGRVLAAEVATPGRPLHAPALPAGPGRPQ